MNVFTGTLEMVAQTGSLHRAKGWRGTEIGWLF